MADDITIQGLKGRAKRFLAADNLEAMALALGKTPLRLLALADTPQYNAFQIPKKDGGKRLVEDPIPALKKVQRKLNTYLQAVYYLHRTDAAYGFVTNPKDDPSPRHILSNAEVHIGCKYLLNIDARNFFHSIQEERVQTIFAVPPFSFSIPLAQLLARLCCYQGRLPMGAPTSPALSNFAAINMDLKLLELASQYHWNYTRYADDMSFSSQNPITEAHYVQINTIIEAEGFQLNLPKKREFGPADHQKEVTGLIVQADRIDLPEDYLLQLEKAIDYLDKIMDAKYSMPSGRSEHSDWIEELKQQIQGKLEYARQILGETDLQYLDLLVQLDEALTPPDYYGPMNWLEFGYSLPH